MRPWFPAHADLTSGTSGGRSPELYLEVVRQFGVEGSSRYAARDGKTWCGTFVWDVTRAMNAEVPHWWMGKELTANKMFDWLEDIGHRYAWERCKPEEAILNANEGRPTVVAWLNIGAGPGHIAMVVPSPVLGHPLIAQAGKHNFVGKSVLDGFGPRPVSYFRHP